MTETHSFTLFLTGVDALTDEHIDALYEAGCDDALFGARDGAQYARFDREAPSFSEALASAIRDVCSAVPGLRVTRVEPDHLVTMAEISRRARLSREYVRLLSSGERGPGAFPAPVGYVDERTRVWHWPDVAKWLTDHRKARVVVDLAAADLIAALNAAMIVREHAPHLDPDAAALVEATLAGSGLGA